MPRIRTLKPEAAQHRKVGRLSIPARWLWATMITQADDEGRLVGDPGQLRLIAFGYDQGMTDAQVATLLAEIAETGLIRRYSVRSVCYFVFDSWKDHQRIDRPTLSKLPAPPQLRSTRPRRSLADPSPMTREGSEGIGGEGIKDQGSRIGGEGSDEVPWPSPEALVALYNLTAPDECPEVTTLSRGRRKKAKEYLAELPERTWWEEAFRQIGKSRFLRGLTPPRNDQTPFTADFDWLLSKGKDGSENCVKVYEGKYHD